MPVTWNTANNTIAQTSNFINTVRGTLSSIGIEVSDLCSKEQINEAVKKSIRQWGEDVNRVVDHITFEMAGNFFTTITLLLGKLVASVAASYSNLFLFEMLAGNILNSIISAVALAFSLMPGTEIVLQYYLVMNLQRDLNRRHELGKILDRQFSLLIELLNSFYNLFKNEDDLFYTDLRKALLNIRQAEKIIGVEVSKNFYGKTPVTLNNLVRADVSIEKAINNLTHQNYYLINAYLTDLNTQYNIGATVPSGLDIKGWTDYFTAIHPFIALTFFTYTTNPSDDGYEQEVNQKNLLYNQFISSMMVVMPAILQRLILTSTFKHATDVIYERIPVWGDNDLVLKKMKNYLDNSILVSDKFLDTYLNMQSVSTDPEPTLFKDPTTKDITWRNITTKIKIEEAGTLLFDSYWDYIKYLGGLLQTVLLPVLGILKSVDAEIDGVLSNEQQLSQTELSVKQFVWIEKLSAARGLMATILNSTEVKDQYGTFGVNPIQVYNSMVESDVAMSKLQQFIRDKAIDPKTQTPKTQPSDVVFDTAQKYLGSLLTNIYIIVNPGAAKNIISGLQAMRVSVRQQMSLDRKEIALCNNFLNAIESNPLFMAVKPYIDQILNSLLQSPIGHELGAQLLNGDLSGIISTLEGYQAAEDVVNLINCANHNTGQNIDPSALGLGSNVTKESMNSIEMDLSFLRDQKGILESAIGSLSEVA